MNIFAPYIGTIVNFAVVLIVGCLGSLLKQGLPERYSKTIMSAMAVCVIYIGIDGVIEAPPPTTSEILSPGLFKVLVMIISMAIGALIGELIDIEKWMGKLGELAEKKLGKLSAGGSFAQGFVSCSILFCVGAMTINGALESARGDHSLLLTKSVIDGVSVLVMSSTLGIGCAFSAFFVLAYQGIITLFATLLVDALSATTLSYMSMTGSLVVILLGTNVLGITKVRTANLVPSMFVCIGVEALLNLIF